MPGNQVFYYELNTHFNFSFEDNLQKKMQSINAIKGDATKHGAVSSIYSRMFNEIVMFLRVDE